MTRASEQVTALRERVERLEREANAARVDLSFAIERARCFQDANGGQKKRSRAQMAVCEVIGGHGCKI